MMTKTVPFFFVVFKGRLWRIFLPDQRLLNSYTDSDDFPFSVSLLTPSARLGRPPVQGWGGQDRPRGFVREVGKSGLTARGCMGGGVARGAGKPGSAAGGSHGKQGSRDLDLQMPALPSSQRVK